MASCLGIYSNQDIVKYAKISMGNDGKFKIEKTGVRFISNLNGKELINSIIEETDSKDIPIIINPQSDQFVDLQVLAQVQNKTSYIEDALKMEFEAWCEKTKNDSSNYSYVYLISEYKTADNKYNAVLDVTEKKEIANIKSMINGNIASIMPSQLMMHKIVPQDEDNYVLVNLDDKLSIVTIVDKKVADVKAYSTGMHEIFSDFRLKLGSYQKAYEACKQINVYTEGKSINDPDLEVVTEQVLQEVLKNVLVAVNKNRKSINKVIITGIGTVFTNIDILFTEFLDIKSEILKPDFLDDGTNIRNIAETLETIQAIALACGYLKPDKKTTIDYVTFSNVNNKFSFKEMFAFSNKKEDGSGNSTGKRRKEDKTQGTEKSKPNVIFEGIEFDKITPYMVCGSIIIGLTIITYIIFGQIYTASINKIVKDIDKNIADVQNGLSSISEDTNYITQNTSRYSTVNSRVESLVSQIEGNQIGKFSTYNVASFLQNIIKIIPTNVQLISISSDDNKKITMKATSNNYANLGYFIAQLKLQNVLNDVKVNNIENGDIITIQIGGELP